MFIVKIKNMASYSNDIDYSNHSLIPKTITSNEIEGLFKASPSRSSEFAMLNNSQTEKLNNSRNSSTSILCRICHEDDSEDSLISPCECAGTLGLVHISCLEQWLSTSNTDHCEICQFKYSTDRFAKPIWQWFRSERTVYGPQGFYGDMFCLLLLSPLCLISIYLCAVGAAVYMQHGFWEGTGLAALCFFLLATFLLWCFVTLRFHYKMLRRWQTTNQTIHLVDSNQGERNTTTSIPATQIINVDSEVNNNGTSWIEMAQLV